jgi:hypothetical protein
MSVLSEMPQCTTDSCEANGVVMLAGSPLCLEHFFQGCYGRLERLDPVVRGRSREGAINGGAPKLLGELVKQVLIVSLQHEKLNNLDRSRLLDILLWAGELQFALRVPHSVSAEEIVYGAGQRHVRGGRNLSGN